MSFLDRLFGLVDGGGSGTRSASDGPDAIAEIAGELDRMEPDRARYVAAFACVLSRVAHADLVVTRDEAEAMEELLVARGGLKPHEACVAADIARRESEARGGTEGYLATREFGTLASKAQRRELVDCLFALAAADGSISTTEEREIRQVASELQLTLTELNEVRSRWNEHREILRG